MSGRATVTTECPACSKEITIDKVWTPGGVNDKGGYILKCSKCNHVFDFHLGRDIQMSRVTGGATVLATYDDEIGDKEYVLARFGLSE